MSISVNLIQQITVFSKHEMQYTGEPYTINYVKQLTEHIVVIIAFSY